MENKSIKEFSELTASKSPVPGGGGVCANIGALAAALGEMVTNLTIGKSKYISFTDELEDIKKELELIRCNLLACINGDAKAFEPLAKAYAMSKDEEGYYENLEKCLRQAADSPMMILKYCKRIIELDERLAVIGSKLSVSDAATSVMIAHGCLYGAYVNILVNTRLMKDQEYALRMNKKAIEIVDKYSVKALNIFDNICKRLTDNG